MGTGQLLAWEPTELNRRDSLLDAEMCPHCWVKARSVPAHQLPRLTVGALLNSLQGLPQYLAGGCGRPLRLLPPETPHEPTVIPPGWGRPEG